MVDDVESGPDAAPRRLTTDTAADAAAVQLAAIRRMLPAARLRDALAFSELMRDLQLTALAALHVDLSHRELAERFLFDASPRPAKTD